MIQSLSINNFALIEKLHIDFSSGFSIITGETGAGKSILLGALGMVLGKRADLTSLKNKDEKCIIEAHFHISNYNLRHFFESNDLDYEEVTILRREVLPSGKSRAFINDTPVNLQELQELSDYLIDVHSQHQTQELSENSYQFQIIDAVAANGNLIEKYSANLKQFKTDTQKLQTLRTELQALLKEEDYTTFLLQELHSISLKSINQAELEEHFEQLNNVEYIKEHVNKAILIANEEQYGVLHLLSELKASIQKVSGFSDSFQNIYNRIDSVGIELKDCVEELGRKEGELVHDPENLQSINQQLQLLYTIQKKHQVNTVEELIQIQTQLESQIHAFAEIENTIGSLESNLKQTAIILDDLAAQIHKNRVAAIPVLTEKWVDMLSQLGMPNVRFKIDLIPTVSYMQNGKEEIQFLFSANKGADFGLLKKVASGGEMSRIMLATKSILANYSKLPTIIFDEIDTGVSGEIANKMSDIMKNMSQSMQVLAITHLPQIAAKGDSQFKVFKTTKNEQTHTEIKQLSAEERIMEIAQMLSGIDVTESALNHAKSLLN
ncbi:MAG: DNA repair protein RecN [Flavobacterium sp.]|nr:DNA repair protein RecN [Flavobacterium sp.]